MATGAVRYRDSWRTKALRGLRLFWTLFPNTARAPAPALSLSLSIASLTWPAASARQPWPPSWRWSVKCTHTTNTASEWTRARVGQGAADTRRQEATTLSWPLFPGIPHRQAQRADLSKLLGQGVDLSLVLAELLLDLELLLEVSLPPVLARDRLRQLNRR